MTIGGGNDSLSQQHNSNLDLVDKNLKLNCTKSKEIVFTGR